MADTVLCVLTHRDGKPHTQDVGLVCGWHRGRLDTTLHEIRDLDTDLDLIAEAGSAPKAATGRGRRLRNPVPPAPANLDRIVLHDPRSHGDVDSVDDVRGEPAASIELVTETYVCRVRDERPLTRIVLRPVRHHDGRVFDVPTTVPALVPRSYIARLDLLIRHHDWVARQEWVGEYWDDMDGLRRAMRRSVRDRSHFYFGKCYLDDKSGAACGGDLLRRNGDDAVVCKANSDHAWRTAGELARLEIALNGTGGEASA